MTEGVLTFDGGLSYVLAFGEFEVYSGAWGDWSTPAMATSGSLITSVREDISDIK